MKLTRADRNNNPGNIEFGAFAKKFGAVLEEGVKNPRFAKFPTAPLGVAALASLLSGPAYSGLNIRQVVLKYAPGSENNVDAYVRFLCLKTGLVETVKVGELDAFEFIELLRAIALFEGYRGKRC